MNQVYLVIYRTVTLSMVPQNCGPPSPRTVNCAIFGPPGQTLKSNPAIQTLESNPAIQTLKTNPANYLYPKPSPMIPLVNGGPGTMHSCYGQSGRTAFREGYLQYDRINKLSHMDSLALPKL